MHVYVKYYDLSFFHGDESFPDLFPLSASSKSWTDLHTRNIHGLLAHVHSKKRGDFESRNKLPINQKGRKRIRAESEMRQPRRVTVSR